MALLLTVVVTVCFFASLLPFMLPGAVIGLLGKVLNDALGDPMWAFVPAVRGTLVASGSEGPMLTFRGVLALYVPLLVVLLRSQRGRGRLTAWPAATGRAGCPAPARARRRRRSPP
jgi:hypothetical protein